MTILVILWAVAILFGVLALKGIRRKERLMERRSCQYPSWNRSDKCRFCPKDDCQVRDVKRED